MRWFCPAGRVICSSAQGGKPRSAFRLISRLLAVFRAAARFLIGRCSGSALLGGFLLAVAPKGTKRACPAIRPCASLRVRSLHRRSEGRRTRGVHAPLRLSPHPCGSPLYATIPLTLLKGRLALPESEREGCSARSVEAISPRSAKKKLPSNSEPESPSGGRVEVLRRGTRGRTPSEERRDRDVPS